MIILDLKSLPKCECGNDLEFVSETKANKKTSTSFGGWREFCSRKCSLSSKSVLERRQQSILERFGEISWAKTEQARNKMSLVWTEEKKEIFREKSKKTNLEKRGVEHHSKTKEYLEKKTETCLRKYGVENTFQLEKTLKAKLKKWGYISWFSTEEGQLYIKNNNPRKTEYINDKIRLSFYQNRKHLNETIREAIYSRNELLFQDIIIKTAKEVGGFRKDIANKLGMSYSNLNFYMRKFGMSDCFITLGKGTSKCEKDLYDFVKSLCPDAIWGDRTVLTPKELDVYVSTKNLAIEMNGVYFHSEFHGGKEQNYHLNKTNECEQKGIKLLHIFDTEWEDEIKRSIWKSIIKSKLGLLKNHIHAENCEVREVENSIAKKFYDLNDLFEYNEGAFLHLGLFNDNELVSLLSLYNKKNLKILRYTNKIETNVVGGFSKLVKYCGFKNLIVFANRRINSTIDSVFLNHFTTINLTSPNLFVFHVKKCNLQQQFNFTEDKIKLLFDSYDDTLTIFDNLVNNGYDRIYDSGNIKFTNFVE